MRYLRSTFPFQNQGQDQDPHPYQDPGPEVHVDRFAHVIGLETKSVTMNATLQNLT